LEIIIQATEIHYFLDLCLFAILEIIVLAHTVCLDIIPSKNHTHFITNIDHFLASTEYSLTDVLTVDSELCELIELGIIYIDELTIHLVL